MKFILIAAVLGCFAGCLEAKPTFFKVVPVPIIVPKVDVLGLFGGLLGVKATLVGQALRTHADLLRIAAGVKGGIANSLIHPLQGTNSLVTPVYVPAESLPQYPAEAAPPPPPPVQSTSYGTPAFR